MVSTSTPKPSTVGSSRSSRSRTPSRIPTPAIKKSKYSTSKSNRSRTPIIMTSTPVQMKQAKKKSSKSSSKKESRTKTPNKKSEGSARKKSDKKSPGKKRKSIVVKDDMEMDNEMDEYRPSKKSKKKLTGRKSIASPVIEFDDDDNDVYEEHLYEIHDSNTGLSTPTSLVRRSKRIRHYHPQASTLNSIMEEKSIEYKSIKNDATNQSINGQMERSSSSKVTDKWSWLGCTVM
ncbi:hypothetical protein BLA29_003835 [Euroglyphus maynei]|uniref:Uncharacterized protein n=1 Tax=Euroglyphus maynei TaxID=6958 RepID=A0A1Y3BKZ5_EURMA|nr:hypothetical protein BLA29_003835 [Euroglyphus maynei]